MSTTFILIRHGEPRYDEIQKTETTGLAWDFGRLTDDGVKQALARAKDERLQDADIIISSPYTRALETAGIIASYTKIPLRVETNLHEWSPDVTFNYRFGPEKEAEMRQVMDEFFGGNGERPRDSKLKYESLSEVKGRVHEVLQKYTSYKKVIVVCHGIVMNAMTTFKDKVAFCGVREIELS